MTFDQFILSKRVYCDECKDLRLATSVVKDNGQLIAVCLEHARQLEPWNHQENQYAGNL
jgi:hypothetical protein